MLIYYILGLIGITLIGVSLDFSLIVDIGLILIWMSLYNMLDDLYNKKT